LFFNFEIDGVTKTFYRTGDLVFIDVEGDIMFCGRLDDQVQIQGFRVEPGEIEFHAKNLFANTQFVAISIVNSSNNREIHLIGQAIPNISSLSKYLSEKLPYYMNPVKIVSVDSLPMSLHGKIDKKKLEKLSKSF